MSSLSRIYTDQLRENFFPLYANFPPGGPLQLGDFGKLNGNIFIRVGNIKALGIDFAVRKDDSAEQYKFTSKAGVKMNFSVGGDGGGSVVGSVKAGLQISFSRENSVFFNAAEGLLDSIEDQETLGRRILEMYKAGQWDWDYAIVTQLLSAQATTVTVSASNQSSVSFEADASATKRIDLADASIKFGVVASEDLAMEITGQGNLTPLMGLSKIQSKKDWLGRRTGDVWGQANVRSIVRNSVSVSRGVGDEEGVEFSLLQDVSDILL